MNESHFKIQVGDYSAEVALAGEWSLYDFAAFITETVGFDFDHAFEFCDNLKNPYQSKERYTLFADMGEEADDPGVKRTRLSRVFHPHRKMVFHFDYGDDWFFLVTCTAVMPSKVKRRFRKILSTRGTPPQQYPGDDEE
ncbi:MAG: IS1096 element passenger TnpR family protein [Chthoniobacterales bacterium]